jgi:hypothetical protein
VEVKPYRPLRKHLIRSGGVQGYRVQNLKGYGLSGTGGPNVYRSKINGSDGLYVALNDQRDGRACGREVGRIGWRKTRRDWI